MVIIDLSGALALSFLRESEINFQNEQNISRQTSKTNSVAALKRGRDANGRIFDGLNLTQVKVKVLFYFFLLVTYTAYGEIWSLH